MRNREQKFHDRSTTQTMKRMFSDLPQVLFLLLVVLFVGISHSPDIHGNMIWLGNDYVAIDSIAVSVFVVILVEFDKY